MLKLFIQSLFMAFLFMLLWINIAFTFNVLNIMNPTNVLGEHANEYYFGLSSFINQFKYYFADNSVLLGFQEFLSKFGNYIGQYYRTYVTAFQLVFGTEGAWGIITLLFAILVFANSLVPMLCMVLLGIFYIIYLFCFVFEIVAFVIAFFGGAFATPLPNTDWWEYTPTIQTLATIV